MRRVCPTLPWTIVALLLWLGACGAGLGALFIYGNTPGDSGPAPIDWRPPDAIGLDEQRPTLYVFAHPRCPCTRATMEAVARLQRRTDLGFATRVIFFEPADADPADGWRSTDLWRKAQDLPDTSAHADPGGELIRQAGAHVSGMAALFAPDARLLFWGGLTPARGHAGDSLGADAINAILEGRAPLSARAPVYGCPLLSEAVCEELCIVDESDG